LNGEVVPNEQMNIQAHLNVCTVCQNEAERINALQGQLIHSLHRRANLVEPTPAAWNQFSAKLAAINRMQKKESKLMRKLAFTTLLVLLVAFVTVAFVPSVQAQVRNVIRRIVYGNYSVIEQIDAQEIPEPRPLPDDMWSVDTDIGGWGGNTPPGMAPIVKSVATLGNAQALASFTILAPTNLPEGYRLREAKISPAGSVFLFYGGPGKDITIIESLVGPGPDSGFVQSQTGSYSVVVNGEVEEVDFDGRKAVWTPDLPSLMWEADGINFTVGGLDLSLEQAMEIARSLR
jgi:hypothetical protein